MNLPNYSFLLVVACFWLAYWLVNRQLVRPVLRILEEREKRHASGLQVFEEAKAAWEVGMRQRESELAQAAAEAQKERQRLRALGEQLRREKLEATRQEAQRRLHAFLQELEEETKTVRENLPALAEAGARELANRLLGRPVRL